jgi:hypothetical protein
MTNNPTVRIIVTYGIIFQALIKSQTDFNIINFRSCLQMTRFNRTRHYDINIDELILMAPGQSLLAGMTEHLPPLSLGMLFQRHLLKIKACSWTYSCGNVKFPCAQLNPMP